MASNKTYAVMKDGEILKELKTMAAAKKLADTEGAEVFCDGECVYRGTVTGSEDTVSVLSEDAEKTPCRYRLTALMNIRKAPAISAEKLGQLPAGTIVEVDSISGDWMHLSDGTHILFAGGKFAVRI